MKKWLIALLVLIIITVAGIYIFIPARLTVTHSVSVSATQEGTLRIFRDRHNWNNIWPGSSNMAYSRDSSGKYSDTSFSYSSQEFDFYINKLLYNGIELTITKNKDSIESTLYILPYQVDSLKLQWTAMLSPTNNPYKRVQNYLTAKKLSARFEYILNHMADALGKVETIYGIAIRKDKIPIQQAITTKRYLPEYPTTEIIYSMIDELKIFAVENGVKQIDHPIFNVWSTEESEFTTQVGLSIDRNIEGNDKYSSKWMMKGGNILTADVKGDNSKVKWAESQMEQYIADNHRSIIAAPFQMLITDRRTEPDSTKWITRLYYPVI